MLMVSRPSTRPSRNHTIIFSWALLFTSIPSWNICFCPDPLTLICYFSSFTFSHSSFSFSLSLSFWSSRSFCFCKILFSSISKFSYIFLW